MWVWPRYFKTMIYIPSQPFYSILRKFSYRIQLCHFIDGEKLFVKKIITLFHGIQDSYNKDIFYHKEGKIKFCSIKIISIDLKLK